MEGMGVVGKGLQLVWMVMASAGVVIWILIFSVLILSRLENIVRSLEKKSRPEGEKAANKG